MKQFPLISIIIPTYNDGNVVCDAVDCSLNQTYENVEVLVVDDGSTDDTEGLLKVKYGNKIRYIKQKNRGLSSARNAGIRHSAGKYLQFLDADDLIDHNKIKCQVELLQNISGPALAYCDYVRSAIDDPTTKYVRMSPVLQAERPIDDFIMKWETHISIPPHCFLFDVSLFKEYGIAFDESLPTHEDWECWMNVFALNPQVVFIDMPLADYRVRGDSMCANKLKMRKGYIKAIDKQIRKNRSSKEVVKKLNIRKDQIKYLYRDASLTMRIIARCPPVIKTTFSRVVPWRIRNFFETQDKDFISRIRSLICPD